MNYAIIRNEKYQIGRLNAIYRHNERKNNRYSNEDIDKDRSKTNYCIKKCNISYIKRFKEIITENNVQGYIKKNSIVACEYIITASPDFFEMIGQEEQIRYFKTAYKFVCEFKNLGEKYIISANVHMDESNPHMHLVYIPIVHTVDKKDGKNIEKICCSDFWKGKNSYKVLQDNFYKYITKSGFELSRGNAEENEHIKIADLKKVTNFELQKYEKQSINLEKKNEINDVNILADEYKRVIKKYNTLAKQYTRIKVINDTNVEKIEETKQNYEELKVEYSKLKNANNYLKYYISKSFECISLLFDYPIERLKRIVNNFINSDKEK